MLTTQEINALGNIVETTWGKSGESNGRSVSASLQADVLTLKFTTIVHFAAENALRIQVERLAAESMDVLSGRVKTLKAEFKEATGKTLSIKELSNRDNIELISSTSNSPRKIAYYRRNLSVTVDA
jgi:hypothetical protein